VSRHSHRLVAGLLFLLIAGGYLLMARCFPFAYIFATYEDRVGEWAQVYFFAAAMVLACIHAVRIRRYRIFYLLLALACFYVVGEEISWGQRIFDIETPEFFRRHNLQQETNLHNLFIGPRGTGISSAIKAIQLAISAGLFLFGLVYPLLLRLRVRPALWLDRIGLPSPPLYLFPFFLLSAWLELGPYHFNEAEVAEILISSALGMMALHSLHRNRQTAPEPAPSSSFAVRLSLAMLALFLGVGVLAAGTTWVYYQTPHLRERMDSRYLNEVEMFADRCRGLELWKNAIDLYRYVQLREPGRASVSRSLYRCYRALNNQEMMRQSIAEAIAIDRQRLKDWPNSIRFHVSMASNYILAGDLDHARAYLLQGLKIAKDRQRQYPGSASTAYGLGRIYQMLDEPQAAYPQYRRAVELQPNNLRYRRALIYVEDYLSQKEDSNAP